MTVGRGPDSTGATARRMARGAAAGGLALGGVAAVVATVVAAVRGSAGDGGFAAIAVVLGALLAVAVLSSGPRLLAAAGRVDAGFMLVVALSVYVFWATLLAGAAAWLLRWDALPRAWVGWGVLAGSLGGTAGVLRGFVLSRTLTFGDSSCDLEHTPAGSAGREA